MRVLSGRRSESRTSLSSSNASLRRSGGYDACDVLRLQGPRRGGRVLVVEKPQIGRIRAGEDHPVRRLALVDRRARSADAHLELTMGDPASAEKEFRKAATLGATPGQIVPGLAMALQGQGQHQKVVSESEALAATMTITAMAAGTAIARANITS